MIKPVPLADFVRSTMELSYIFFVDKRKSFEKAVKTAFFSFVPSTAISLEHADVNLPIGDLQ